MTRHDRKLLEDSLESLERSGCQFWAREGPTLRPKSMITCHACHMIAKLRKRLANPLLSQVSQTQHHSNTGATNAD